MDLYSLISRTSSCSILRVFGKLKKKSSHFPVFGILERFMSSEDFFLQFLDPGGA